MKSKGFTLVELLIVIAIIGILAAIAIPGYVGIQKRHAASENGGIPQQSMEQAIESSSHAYTIKTIALKLIENEGRGVQAFNNLSAGEADFYTKNKDKVDAQVQIYKKAMPKAVN